MSTSIILIWLNQIISIIQFKKKRKKKRPRASCSLRFNHKAMEIEKKTNISLHWRCTGLRKPDFQWCYIAFKTSCQIKPLTSWYNLYKKNEMKMQKRRNRREAKTRQINLKAYITYEFAVLMCCALYDVAGGRALHCTAPTTFLFVDTHFDPYAPLMSYQMMIALADCMSLIWPDGRLAIFCSLFYCMKLKFLGWLNFYMEVGGIVYFSVNLDGEMTLLVSFSCKKCLELS